MTADGTAHDPAGRTRDGAAGDDADATVLSARTAPGTDDATRAVRRRRVRLESDGPAAPTHEARNRRAYSPDAGTVARITAVAAAPVIARRRADPAATQPRSRAEVRDPVRRPLPAARSWLVFWALVAVALLATVGGIVVLASLR